MASGNRLGKESSLYLRQHKDNPVDWRVWGTSALAEAQATGKPVLLSIGYAACHWCHVMAHESFEDRHIASLINAHFIPIKVDREEHPDVDWVYQQALALLGERGGWPLTMFLTPQGEPFWGGTYFPPQPRYGRPGFEQILRGVAHSYSTQSERVDHNVGILRRGLQNLVTNSTTERLPPPKDEREIALTWLKAVDWQRGGLGAAPKFPQASFFSFLWRHSMNKEPGHERLKEAVILTLRCLCRGGIYDHVGGGFARYSTDADWLVPHFEKMLYDNALILEWLAECRHQDPLFATVIDETVSWLLREMKTESGGFAGSLDADSAGGEGAFYVWSEAEIDRLLGKDSVFFKDIFDITPTGNWEGVSIANRLGPVSVSDEGQAHKKDGKTYDTGGRYAPEQITEKTAKKIARCKGILRTARQKRSAPARDDKVLADWNGMMIAALARVSFLRDDGALLDTAHDVYRSVCAALCRDDGRLSHSFCQGQARHSAMLDDYAHMARAALVLGEVHLLRTVTGDGPVNTEGRRGLIDDAVRWVSILNADYWDTTDGGYHMAGMDRDDLILSPKTASDQAIPSGNAVACEVLARLYLMTGRTEYRDRARALLAAFSGAVAAAPIEHCALLTARAWLEDPVQIVLTGAKTGQAALLGVCRQYSLPPGLILTDRVLWPGHPAQDKKSRGQKQERKRGQAAAYVCRGPVCLPPVQDAASLAALLDDIGSTER